MNIVIFITLVRLLGPGVTHEEVVMIPDFKSREACEAFAKETKKLSWSELNIKTKCIGEV